LGSCFLALPALVKASDSAAGLPSSDPLQVLVEDGTTFDATIPSDSLLDVLLDVSLAMPRRWSRSLRLWRERRGLRDVVFSEPGGLGLELDEPDLHSSDPERHSWRLRATHPPASSLQIEGKARLVAVNRLRVHSGTARGEVAKRVACRPVSMTFRCNRGAVFADDLGMALSMAAAEVTVGELREGLPPLKNKEPPLSTVAEHIARTSGNISPKEKQARRILATARVTKDDIGTSTKPAMRLPEHPALLYLVLLFCGDLVMLPRVGFLGRAWSKMILHGARRSEEDLASSTQAVDGDTCARGTQRLWQWVVRWGRAPPRSKVPGLWRWALQTTATDANRPVGNASDPSEPTSQSSCASAVLLAAMKADAASLLGFSQGLGGACPGSQIVAAMVSRLVTLVKGAGGNSQHNGPQNALAPLDSSILEALLREPFCLQRVWFLSEEALPWLVAQCRCFQVEFAAHCPRLFRHFMNEGLAPELFYCWWLQQGMLVCSSGTSDEEDLLRLWHIFVFERSHKIFVRAAVALIGILEPKLRGDVDQIVKVLFSQQTWDLGRGTLIDRALATKVTRSAMQKIIHNK